MTKAQELKRRTVFDKLAGLAKDMDVDGLRHAERLARKLAMTITKTKNEKTGFKKGVSVSFPFEDKTLEGVIVYMGARRATVAVAEVGRWRVGYGILKVVEPHDKLGCTA